MKHILTAILLAASFLVACDKNNKGGQENEQKTLVILYENDVHNGHYDSGYPRAAGLRDAINASDTAYCMLVSSGDFLQGGVVGALSEGEDIALLMQRSAYDAACIGNHELDFGTKQLADLAQMYSLPVICMNFIETKSQRSVFARYRIVGKGGKKIAFIGVLTPETTVDEKWALYDDDGNQIYDVISSSLCQEVQKTVDEVRQEGADYVILLCHLGEKGTGQTSVNLINATAGIDVVLDGHTHSIIDTTVIDKNGKGVFLSQTGTQFSKLGKLVITKDGRVSGSLQDVTAVSECSSSVQATVDSIKSVIEKKIGTKIGVSDITLSIKNEKGERIVRKEETNIGDFIADAFRYAGKSEIAFVNGGAIREDIKQGDVTYGNILAAMPFSNIIQVISVQGKVLVDVLSKAAEGAEKGNESGFFPQVSGMKFQIEKSGDKRILPEKVRILSSKTGDYEPLDVEKYYSLSVTDYVVDTFEELTACEVLEGNISADSDALCKYIKEKLSGRIGNEYAASQGRITFN